MDKIWQWTKATATIEISTGGGEMQLSSYKYMYISSLQLYNQRKIIVVLSDNTVHELLSIQKPWLRLLH